MLILLLACGFVALSQNNPYKINDRLYGDFMRLQRMGKSPNCIAVADSLYAEAVKLVDDGFVYWFTTDEIQELSKYVEQFADHTPEEELLDVYFEVPRPMGKETRTVHFLTTSEIQAKLITYGNLHRPIPLRTLCQVLDNKGFQRMRNGNKRGYLVVELEAAEINSRRIASTGVMPF